MNDDYKEIDSSIWKEVEENNNKVYINFKNNKRKSIFKFLAKLLIFVIIAFVAGSISASYQYKKKYANIFENYAANTNQVKNVELEDTVIKENSINRVAEIIKPAVVAINNKSWDFFSGINSSLGSGVIFKSDGYIVTNYHVIAGASKLIVRLSSGKELQAKIIGTDPRSDLAVIKIQGSNFPVAKFGDSSDIKVGDLAIAVGNPIGEEFGNTVTAGIISAKDRTISLDNAVYKVIQTDAAINPGNSGGALCNEKGEVIGINSLKIGSQYNAEGMGFAIQINEVKNIVDQLIKQGYVVRPYIGIYGGTANPEITVVEGAYVNKIIRGSGADKAGIRPGDVIIELDGKKIKEFDDISQVLEMHKVGDVIKGVVYRNGEKIDVNIELKELK